jgi:hypothetical protein
LISVPNQENGQSCMCVLGVLRESTLSKSDYLVGHFGLGRTYWSDVRVDIKRFFFTYLEPGEYVIGKVTIFLAFRL